MDANCYGPIPRREFLQAGALALGGLSLDQLLAARQENSSTADTSVIMLYLHGGPSHLETYDLKPEAPSSYRSIYRPISTNVAGMDICELFPRQAKVADKFSLVRSLNHDVGIHSDGGIVVLTGKRPEVLDPTSQSKSQHPDIGSIASKVRGITSNSMPPFVAIPQQTYMTRPAYLGVHHRSLIVRDPSSPTYQPPLGIAAGNNGSQLGNRRNLLAQLDDWRKDLEHQGQAEGIDRFRALAFEMLTSPKVAQAFDLARETDSVRDRYGRNLWGQSCLLARRLAEAGTAVVSLYINTPQNGPDFTNWDDHILNAGRPGHFGKYMDRRLPYLDESLSALIEDIFQRGLDQKILVCVVGEFGRTPRLSHNANGTGRDHWPQAYTALLSGGGLRMGQVVGATNSKGEFPTESPYTPQDLLATIYRHLDINPSQTLNDFAGRPVAILPSGRPISELL